ncbi:MAG: DUF1707 SHOCT-like domain-containing protein, partial [Solirubrobacteraceae bacterium]
MAAVSAGGSSIRVSDQDRERAAETIREHYAAGRLDAEEFDARLTAVYAAKTEGDLHVLHADLPALPQQLELRQSAEIQLRRTQLSRRVLQRTGGCVGVFALCSAIWAIDGAHGQFWPVWVLIPGGIWAIRGFWALYGPAPDHDRLEAELDARERRHGAARRRGGG